MDPRRIHFVSSTDSPEFTQLARSLARSQLVGLDAEWKPTTRSDTTPSLPTVTLLQIACQLISDPADPTQPPHLAESNESTESGDSVVFLIDLMEVELSGIYELLKEVFVSGNVLKLGFRFKQDLVYLSSTFRAAGFGDGFDRVEPYLDITSIYNHIHNVQRRKAKDTKSLSVICKEILGISLSKELQCSDWSCRPLTEEQKIYAALDAHCLIEIFSIFRQKVLKEGNTFCNINKPDFQGWGLKQILEEPNNYNKIIRTRSCKALKMVLSATFESPRRIHTTKEVALSKSGKTTLSMNYALLQIVREYADKIVLKESDGKPKSSRKKGKKHPSARLICKGKPLENIDDWQGPAPWDSSVGGDGCPRFLCDVMVEGLAKHLRCVGIDAAVPNSRKPESRELIEQAYREKRILLTRDAKLLRHGYMINNQIYRVKTLLKNEQLLEVIETFQLKICEDQLMSRCTKCNGGFIQKPLSTEEALEAAKGFQVIPNCLFDKNLEFWQCRDCNQLYWEGTQYHNAVQKFIDVCKLTNPVNN